MLRNKLYVSRSISFALIHWHGLSKVSSAGQLQSLKEQILEWDAQRWIFVKTIPEPLNDPWFDCIKLWLRPRHYRIYLILDSRREGMLKLVAPFSKFSWKAKGKVSCWRHEVIRSEVCSWIVEVKVGPVWCVTGVKHRTTLTGCRLDTEQRNNTQPVWATG